MGYKLEWIIPKRVIRLELSGEMNEQIAQECNANVCKMMDEGDAEAALIHTILKVGQMTTRPNLKLLTSLSFAKHPRNGWLIGVGISNALLRMVFGLAGQIMGMRSMGIDTVEEALELLYEMDSTITRQDSFDASV